MALQYALRICCLHAFLISIITLAPKIHANEELGYLFNLTLQELLDLRVTIATGTQQNTLQAPSVITVITQDDIKLTGASNLTQVLQAVPGVYIRHNYFGFRPLIHMRGTHGRQTLLMVNGISMRDLVSSFGLFWKGLPVSIIERVEVIRGPASAVYGADAGSGVINVITKTASKIQGNEVGAQISSFNTQNAWLQYSRQWHRYQMNMTANVYHTDAHQPLIESDTQTVLDQSLGTQSSLAPGLGQYGYKSADLRVSVSKAHWQLQGDYRRQSDWKTALDPATNAHDDRININLHYQNNAFNELWGLDSQINFRRLSYGTGDGLQLLPPGAFAGAYPDGVFDKRKLAESRYEIENRAVYSGFDQHTLRLGLGFSFIDLYRVSQFVNSGTGPDGNPLPIGSSLVELSGSPFAYAQERTRSIWHGFIQDMWQISSDLELTSGMRYDHYSDFGDILTPRLALVWKSTKNLTSKLLYGEAFRPPSFLELYNLSSLKIPNPNLKPEESNTWELAFIYTATQNLHLGINAYQITLHNFIRPTPVLGLNLTQSTNNPQAHHIHGIETEFRWQVAQDLRLSGNYSVRRPDDNEFRMVQLPQQSAYARCDWAFHSNWNWNLQSSWIAQRKRADGDSRENLDDALITDTTLRYTGLLNWQFSASVRNLFDEHAREHTDVNFSAHDLPQPERNVFVQLSYKFPD